MFKSRILMLSLLALLCAAHAFAQSSANKSAKRAFSSLYTDLNKECRNAFKSVGEGQDMPLKCKGYGGYSIYIYYSAWASQITADPSNGRLKDSESLIYLTQQQLSYDGEKGRKIEWRMMNGKPFAVILRVSKYSAEAGREGDNPFDPKYKTGEALLVKGLKGHNIDFEVDPKTTPNPNEKARQLADSNYDK
ncbi:MAG TPA: hypothetical protein VGC89_00370 [Pyrinomonadaceae bacterium]|jgi:hypothetical protein